MVANHFLCCICILPAFAALSSGAQAGDVRLRSKKARLEQTKDSFPLKFERSERKEFFIESKHRPRSSSEINTLELDQTSPPQKGIHQRRPLQNFSTMPNERYPSQQGGHRRMLLQDYSPIPNERHSVPKNGPTSNRRSPTSPKAHGL